MKLKATKNTIKSYPVGTTTTWPLEIAKTKFKEGDRERPLDISRPRFQTKTKRLKASLAWRSRRRPTPSATLRTEATKTVAWTRGPRDGGGLGGEDPGPARGAPAAEVSPSWSLRKNEVKASQKREHALSKPANSRPSELSMKQYHVVEAEQARPAPTRFSP